MQYTSSYILPDGMMASARSKVESQKGGISGLRHVPRGGANVRASRGESVYKTLKDRILTLRLRPAQRISEIQVAKELGVSRTPAREALRRLEQEGWLVLVPRQGYFVRAYSLREVNQVYDLRIAIERHTARTAAERAPDASLARLAERWDALDTRGGAMSPLDWLDADEAFHLGIAAVTGNAELVDLLRRINERIRIIRRIDYSRPERATSTRRDHLEILALIQARAPQAAADRMERHILDSEESVKALAQIYFVQE
ncbi:MAG TPA: GntR family transcriptional regulator [bacterium]|nr:GntR family transcriptional regulator [bacterium]